MVLWHSTFFYILMSYSGKLSGDAQNMKYRLSIPAKIWKREGWGGEKTKYETNGDFRKLWHIYTSFLSRRNKGPKRKQIIEEDV